MFLLFSSQQRQKYFFVEEVQKANHRKEEERSRRRRICPQKRGEKEWKKKKVSACHFSPDLLFLYHFFLSVRLLWQTVWEKKIQESPRINFLAGIKRVFLSFSLSHSDLYWIAIKTNLDSPAKKEPGLTEQRRKGKTVKHEERKEIISNGDLIGAWEKGYTVFVDCISIWGIKESAIFRPLWFF